MVHAHVRTYNPSGAIQNIESLHTYNALYKHPSMCAPERSTHDASFSLYKDLLLLAGREAGPERWLLFTEPAPTLKEAQLDFLRFLLRGKKDGRRREGFSEE